MEALRHRRIGIDVRSLTPPVTGTGVYLAEVLAQLMELAPENEYLCYATKEAAFEALPSERCLPRLGVGPSARWGTVWLQSGLVRRALRDRIDLFWGPLQVVPLPLARRMPLVVTLHDLVFHLYPQTMSLRNRLALPLFARRSLRVADAVLAVSEATAAAAERELGVARERMTVVPHGSNPRFRVQESAAARRRVEEALGVRDDYLLFIGTLEPRKNLDGLLRAIDRLRRAGRFAGRLLIVGAAGWKSSRLVKRIEEERRRGHVVLAGYVADELMPAVYAAARLLVMPSHYEGFGLPVLEAMSCGTPVVASERPPFPEITGAAAHLVDAADDEALAAGIDRIWNDEVARRELARRGPEQASRFSWRRSAEQLLEVFARVLSERGGERR